MFHNVFALLAILGILKVEIERRPWGLSLWGNFPIWTFHENGLGGVLSKLELPVRRKLESSSAVRGHAFSSRRERGNPSLSFENLSLYLR